MTALQDWLNFPPVTPQSVKTLVLAPLRSVMPGVLPAKQDTPAEPPLLQPGLERC